MKDNYGAGDQRRHDADGHEQRRPDPNGPALGATAKLPTSNVGAVGERGTWRSHGDSSCTNPHEKNVLSRAMLEESVVFFELGANERIEQGT
jgi:hypothetical protein